MKKRNAVNPNALLVWIPKTAGTSLNSLLTDAGGQMFLSTAEARRYFRNRGIVTFGHISVPHLREAGIIHDEFYRSALKFAFVRNPFDRAVSLFEYSRLIAKIPASMGFPTFCQMLKDHAYEDIGDYNHLGLSQLNPQTRWLSGSKGELCVDFVGRFESFEDDVRVVLRRLNLPTKNGAIPHVNRSQRMATETYYCDAEVEAVQHAYRCDFEAFGYSLIPRWTLERASRVA
ncbi:MAG TPA: sulfotransferase family 2 domain-containing protein [Lacipirellulaceae bacterium]|nr:sulfotransferase family 2 domain-containing protein [Lacipirellulaceae bacterium]